MPIWRNCKYEVLYYDDDADLDEPCEVRIDEDSIVVSYDGEEGPIVYKGKNNGDGHFELLAPEVKGQSSLHMFENGKILEGFWMEDGNRGMWRIRLA